jgi:hypothetical protein
MSPPKSGVWARRDEPAWHDPSVLLALAAVLVVTNLGHIQAAFSTGTRATSDLVVFRNYFAHRNQTSRAAALSRARLNGVSTTGSIADIALQTPVGRHQSLLEEWVSDLEFISEFICE